jgi:hypothetical protein
VELEALAESFESIRTEWGGMPEHGKFLDLGSGTGKGCLAAALVHPFESVHGIELLSSLYETSLELKSSYETTMPDVQVAHPDIFATIPTMTFEQSDFLTADIYDYNVIFANSTCFTEEMVATLSALPVKPGCYLINTTQAFGGSWEILERTMKPMSWARATVFISHRLPPET